MNTEFKGTKGWKLGDNINNTVYKKEMDADLDIISIDVDEHTGCIMVFGEMEEAHRANAKLIAAAPDLLEALKVGLDAIRELHEHQEGWEDDEVLIVKAINKALN
tara:strand:+ start:17 stop:331 length:315 start_codon:yes stop_codon:yes gene_type:complete